MMRNFIISAPYLILLGGLNRVGVDWTEWNTQKGNEKCNKIFVDLQGRDNLQNLGVIGSITLKGILQKYSKNKWTGFAGTGYDSTVDFYEGGGVYLGSIKV